jgi:hypothetical protein
MSIYTRQARLDNRVYEAKHKIKIVNVSDEVLPAYNPLVLTYDNQQHFDPFGSPFLGGYSSSSAGIGVPQGSGSPRTIVNGELIWPASFACIAETGYTNCLYAINGPFDIAPDGYGTAYLDYPLPITIDPDSFPIPDGSGSFVPGTWDDYQDAYPGDIEGPPPCGLATLPGVSASAGPDGIMWQPANFMSQWPLWTVLWWDVDRNTGEPLSDRAIVVPYSGLAGAIPYGGTVAVELLGALCLADVFNPAGLPLTIRQQGLFDLSFFGTLEVQAVGVAASILLQVTFGPQWDLVDLTGTPVASGYAAPPVSGETVTLASIGRKMPLLNVVGPYGAEAISYVDYGYEPIHFEINSYFMPGDVLTMWLVTDGDAVVSVAGSLSYNKVSTNPYGSFAIFY